MACKVGDQATYEIAEGFERAERGVVEWSDRRWIYFSMSLGVSDAVHLGAENGKDFATHVVTKRGVSPLL